jgi:hypothetical protein
MNPTAADPIPNLWREARTWLADAMHDFLGPAEIARTLARKARGAIKRRLLKLEALVMKLLLIEAVKLRPPHHPFPGRRTAASPGPINTSRGAQGATKVAPCVHTSESMGPGLGAARQSGNGCETDPSTWRVRFVLRFPPAPRAPHQRPRDTGGPRIRDLGPSLLVRDIWRDNARRALIARLKPKADAAASHARAQAKALKLAHRWEALRRVLADPRRAIAALARKLAALREAAFDFARRLALAPAPRGKREGKIFSDAVVYAHDACYLIPDSS